jgi:hypothetical protein
MGKSGSEFVTSEMTESTLWMNNIHFADCTDGLKEATLSQPREIIESYKMK